MTRRGDIRGLLRRLEQAGCTVTRGRNHHWHIRLPDGRVIVRPSTPGNNNSQYRSLRDLADRLETGAGRAVNGKEPA
ncbi:hypothetical protein [Bifidobacterium jacchi]|uniref:Uncharacterized protein n=1 Tax=Bifidobacterium jacchi TaxID=2490545 RepID=A0A5N5RM77_9BIFI|nr:hypothetical protein [Bifidobacterium jacchi]KAB5608398.1 hypothetical protein EHS19_01890 [Bifidobacterium jacchi]